MSAWGQGYKNQGQDNYRGRSSDRNRGRSYNYQGRGNYNYNQNYNQRYNYDRGNQGYQNNRGGYQDNHDRRGQGYQNNQGSYRDNYERRNQGYGNQRGGYSNNSNYDRNYSSNYNRGRGSYSNNNNNSRGGFGRSSPSTIWGQQANNNSSQQNQNNNYNSTNNQMQPNLNVNSYQVIIDDLNVSERPDYILSCYGHLRDKKNDLDGDVSFEELRWLVKSATQQGVADQQKIQQTINKAIQEKEKAFGILRRQGNRPPSSGGPAIITRDVVSILQEIFITSDHQFQSGAIRAPTIAPIPEEVDMQETTPIHNTPSDIPMQSATTQFTTPPPPQQNQPHQNYKFFQQLSGNSNNAQKMPLQSNQSGDIVSNGVNSGIQVECSMDVWKLEKFELGMIPEEPPPPEVCR